MPTPTPSEPIRLLIELETVDPVGGTLEADTGKRRRFSGWIGLATAIDQAIQQRRDRQSTQRRGARSDPA
jgi:hypothetical protein